MKHKFTIHRASWHPRDTDVALPSGEVVKATVQCLELEMVPDGHEGGSVTFRLVGAEADGAAGKFKDGDKIEVSISKVDGDAGDAGEGHEEETHDDAKVA